MCAKRQVTLKQIVVERKSRPRLRLLGEMIGPLHFKPQQANAQRKGTEPARPFFVCGFLLRVELCGPRQRLAFRSARRCRGRLQKITKNRQPSQLLLPSFALCRRPSRPDPRLRDPDYWWRGRSFLLRRLLLHAPCLPLDLLCCLSRLFSFAHFLST